MNDKQTYELGQSVSGMFSHRIRIMTGKGPNEVFFLNEDNAFDTKFGFIKLYLGLSHSLASILQRLCETNGVCTYAQIFASYGQHLSRGDKREKNAIVVQIYGLNKALKPLGIKAQPVSLKGYILSLIDLRTDFTRNELLESSNDAKKKLIRVATERLYDALEARDIRNGMDRPSRPKAERCTLQLDTLLPKNGGTLILA